MDARSHEIARQLGITGTPTFIIGNTLVPGYPQKAQLAAIIAEVQDSTGKP